MRITLVISSLSGGGAGRVMTVMANYWADKAWEITVLTFDDGSTPPFYELDPRICYQTLDIAGDSPNQFVAVRSNIKRIVALRRAISDSKPACVISFMDQTNVLTLLATRTLGIPVVVSERVDPQSYRIGRLWRWLRRHSYDKADRLVVQTALILSRFSPSIQSRGRVIPNPVLPPGTTAEKHLPKPDVRSLVSVGRLNHQKGFDILLEAFAKVRARHPSWVLTIVGEGSMRQDLESLRDDLGLSNSVELVGKVNNPQGYLRQAELFVMASRFEGFPNALCEAMACGVPVISTDCPTGPSEIIRNGVDGILVPNEDVAALTAAIDRLMSDASERKRLASRAPEVIQRFGVAKVMDMWEDLLNTVVNGRPQ